MIAANELFKTKEDLVKFLHYIRKTNTCSYLGYTCDCKYGTVERLNNVELKDILAPKSINRHHHGEETGCCELWSLIEVFDKMTDIEFKMFMEIANRR